MINLQQNNYKNSKNRGKIRIYYPYVEIDWIITFCLFVFIYDINIHK